MKKLVDFVNESLFDLDDKDFTPYVLAEGWAKEHLSHTRYKVMDDGTIVLDRFCRITIKHDNLPGGVKFSGEYVLTLESCSNADMSVFGGAVSSVHFTNCDIKRFTGVLEADSYVFEDCRGGNIKCVSGQDCIVKFDKCTGVGIEIGDEVVVYCASGSFGKSNGVARDVVVGFTPKMVKTKNNGNRPSTDICILRPHKVAEMFFNK